MGSFEYLVYFNVLEAVAKQCGLRLVTDYDDEDLELMFEKVPPLLLLAKFCARCMLWFQCTAQHSSDLSSRGTAFHGQGQGEGPQGSFKAASFHRAAQTAKHLLPSCLPCSPLHAMHTALGTLGKGCVWPHCRHSTLRLHVRVRPIDLRSLSLVEESTALFAQGQTCFKEHPLTCAPGAIHET